MQILRRRRKMLKIVFVDFLKIFLVNFFLQVKNKLLLNDFHSFIHHLLLVFTVAVAKTRNCNMISQSLTETNSRLAQECVWRSKTNCVFRGLGLMFTRFCLREIRACLRSRVCESSRGWDHVLDPRSDHLAAEVCELRNIQTPSAERRVLSSMYGPY